MAIDSEADYLGDAFVLVDDIDFDDIDDDDFIGIGSPDQPFAGSFDGDGHTIENFSVHIDDERESVGLFRNSQGTIESVELSDVHIEAEEGQAVGSLVGFNEGSVTEAQASGEITAGEAIGGLVGLNHGEMTATEASVDVEGAVSVGGLLGDNFEDAQVAEADASGNVVGKQYVGGLLGSGAGDVSKSQASGDVDGEDAVGGLVGLNMGEVVETRASGDVEGDGRHSGGLIGSNVGEVSDGWASGDVQGDTNVGGFIGVQGSIEASVARSLSVGAVDGEEDVGGFAGSKDEEEPGPIEHSYWNTDTAGVDDSAGGVGLTDDEFTDPESFEGFEFCPGDDCRWVMDEDEGRPVLEAFAE